MTLRERLFGSQTDFLWVMESMDGEWRTKTDIIERAGYHPNTIIDVDLLKLENGGMIESKWAHGPYPRTRLYRRYTLDEIVNTP